MEGVTTATLKTASPWTCVLISETPSLKPLATESQVVGKVPIGQQNFQARRGTVGF